MENKKYTITIFTENRPGVLYRIADVFLKRKINIDSLTVTEIPVKGSSRFTIVLQMEPEMIEKIVKQLEKIIEVLEVYSNVDEDLYFNEIAIIRIGIENSDDFVKIGPIVNQSNARIAKLSKNSIIIEHSGTEEEINKLIEDLKDFEIKDLAVSGRTAVYQGKE